MKKRHIDQAAEYIRNGIAVGNLPAQCEAAADMLQRCDMVLVPVDVLTRAEFVMRVEGWREDWQAGDGSKRADAYAAVLSQLAARDDDALPAGMVLVPVEPTPGMIDAARACQLTCEYADIYRVMIAARDEDALPEGTVMVPVEPTPKMLNAAAPFPEHLRAEHPDPADPWHDLMRAATATDQAVARSTYRTMIAAREAEPS